MHETAVADSIIKTILDHANKVNAKPVVVRVSCGQFNALNDHAMQFAFEAVTVGTVCEGMQLEIKHIPLRAKCRSCQALFEFDVYNPVCEKCGSQEFDFEKDAELLIEEIEFEQSEGL